MSLPESFPVELLAPPDPTRLPLPPAAPVAPGVRLVRGAVYAVPEGSRPLEMDLWLPTETPEPAPVVVFVHGGAWRTGLRDDLGPRFRHWRPGPFSRLVRAGFAVACPAYRLSGEVTHPGQLDDLSAALTWLHVRSAGLRLDCDRTVVWGESAGGHLAALLALTADDLPVRGCVTWYAPTDLARLPEDQGAYDATDPGTFEALLLGGALADLPEHARDASPVSRVSPGAPHFLVLHGTDDVIVPHAQAERLVSALHQAGADAELVSVRGGDHLWVGIADDEVERCFAASVDFAARCVG
ncbi:alpha/beta hydrolase [Streptomyces gilvifuscus]|uniref:Alpha/beta hydrolase n=1 Tax=Streptomyces gilvifuscus TaxID=1550617 RepID=A0ABT5G6I4_9ACTN|nr:alpha/beta hydrolase [Streptomyces gilvifuscus]MDC2960340.1 alpha/beta hydrolase [Streptomyces gilvifuscus]